jgi:hypothetical protein
MVDTGAISNAGKKKKRPEPKRHGGNPPQIDIQGAASPIVERPQDYVNADAVYSTGQGAVSGYHYDRQGVYADQLASAEVAQVKGPGQA